jgi:cytochrome c peroxidase
MSTGSDGFDISSLQDRNMRTVITWVIAVVCGCGRGESTTSQPPTPEPKVEAPQPRELPARRPPEKPASASAYYATRFAKRPPVAELTALGALAFRDPGLSASGKLACATCHDPDHAFAPGNADAIQLGGPTGKLAGTRATPSLRYLQTVPRFTEHYHDTDDRDDVDQGPAGGLTWDGRAQTTHEQASAPLMSPVEMANASPDDVVARLKKAPYADRFKAGFGADVLDSTELAFKALTWTLEVYQQDPASFYPYTSKYDAVLRGQAKLSEQEERGRKWFDDPAVGNCASCHGDAIGSGLPAFTDFGFNALGVPRNRATPANADPAYFDLGLCGPYRTDLAQAKKYCGMFRTPSLRNVATRKRFFHNGGFTSLTKVVQFYATRDTNPERWYPRGTKFDDLPAQYHANVNIEPPFGGKPGDTPHLDDKQVADIVAYLGTLTDGYKP